VIDDLFSVEELGGDFLRLSNSSQEEEELEDTAPEKTKPSEILRNNINCDNQKSSDLPHSILVPNEIRIRLGDQQIYHILQLSGIIQNHHHHHHHLKFNSDLSLITKIDNFLSFCFEAKNYIDSWDWFETFLHHLNSTYLKTEIRDSNASLIHQLCQTLFVPFTQYYYSNNDHHHFQFVGCTHSKIISEELCKSLSKSLGIITVISKHNAAELALYFPLLLQLFLPVVINTKVSDQSTYKVNDLPAENLVEILETLRRVLGHLSPVLADQIEGFLSVIIKGNASMKVVESALSALFTLSYLSPKRYYTIIVFILY
jgi:hypothetical protein